MSKYSIVHTDEDGTIRFLNRGNGREVFVLSDVRDPAYSDDDSEHLEGVLEYLKQIWTAAPLLKNARVADTTNYSF